MLACLPSPLASRLSPPSHPYVLISLLLPSLPSVWIIDLLSNGAPTPKQPKAPQEKHHPSSHDSHPAGYSARTNPVCVAVDRADVAYLCAISLLCPFHPLLRLIARAYYMCHVASLYRFTTSIRTIHPIRRPHTRTQMASPA